MAPVASLNELANSGIQGPSEDALLQPDMLKSLLSSVNNLNESVLKLQEENKALHESVSKLKDENKEVKNKLSTLQEHCGVVFTYFPELPPELRR
jgi:predicted  nucleic acid-binding Zn-ribbon protein